MAFYDTAAALQNATPVSAYNHGKALKSALRLQEAESILKEKEGENYEEAFALEQDKVGVAKKRNEIDEGELYQKYKQFSLDVEKSGHEALMKELPEVETAHITAGNLYDQVIEDGGSEEQATELAQQYVSNAAKGFTKFSKLPFDRKVSKAMQQTRDDKLADKGTQHVGLINRKTKEVIAAGYNPESDRYTYKGKTLENVDDYYPVPGGANATELTNTERAKIENLEIGTDKLIGTVGDAVQQVIDDPSSLTTVSKLAGKANSMVAEAKAMADSMGMKVEPGVLDVDSYAKDFREKGIASAQMQSLLVGLAFQSASVTAQQEGRDVSNADVQRFLALVGGNTSDPETFVTVATKMAQRADRDFRNAYKIKHGGKEFEGSTGLEKIPKWGKKSDLPDGISEEDMVATMEANNMSRQQVLDALAKKKKGKK